MGGRQVGAVARLARAGQVTSPAEDTLVDAALTGDPGLLLLAKHYAHADSAAFARHALRHLSAASTVAAAAAAAGG